MRRARPQKLCCNCYFSKSDESGLLCLKNPPIPDTETGEARWPVVKRSDFCGVFRFDDESVNTAHWTNTRIPIYRDSFGDYCKIPLTQGRFAKVDPADYLWLAQFRWHCKTNRGNVYAVRTITESGKQKRIYMHRLIAKTPDNLVCDHINHNGLDNRGGNLRNCTIKQNNANSRSARKASSKYKGVSWSKSKMKWAVYIKKDNRQHFLGHFDSEIEAAKTYDRAAYKLNGDYAMLNFSKQKIIR